MNKRTMFTLLVAALALPTLSYKGSGAAIQGIQPDMLKQVEFARNDIREGEWPLAIARTNLVAFDKPLKVYVNYSQVPPELKDRCNQAVLGAFEIWEKGLGDPQFELATDEKSADVKIQFEPNVFDGRYAVGGLVRWRRSVIVEGGQPSNKTDAEARIRFNNPRGGTMSMELLRHECSHELGHVLGLEDSNRSGEVMSMLDLRAPVKKAAPIEIQGIQRMRQLATEVKQEAVAVALAKV